MDVTPITAVIGAITGCVALAWNVLIYIGFELEIYDLGISFEKEKDPWKWKQFIKFSEPQKNINKYSDDVIILRGKFRVLLRKEGQRYKNHHVNSFGIEVDKKMKVFLTNMLADPPAYISLFPYGEVKDLRLFEGAPLDIEVHSNPLFLKREWQNIKNIGLDEVTRILNEFIETGNYKTDVQLTTYKYPLVYVKKGHFYHRERLWKRVIDAIRWRLKI